VSEDARSATQIASASTTTAEMEFGRVNTGHCIVVRRQVPSSVSIPFLDVDLNQDAQDFNDLNN
jgi:hypothetical protein